MVAGLPQTVMRVVLVLAAGRSREQARLWLGEQRELTCGPSSLRVFSRLLGLTGPCPSLVYTVGFQN